jgi:hypothetical protein
MAVSVVPTGTMTRAHSLGHLALHYAPGDEAASRHLLGRLGFELVDNGPLPGQDGFCTVVVDRASHNHAENLMFLSRMSDAQQAVEAAIREHLRIGEADEDASVTAFRASRQQSPESAAHLGVRYSSLEEIEDVVVAHARDAEPGGPLAGRVEVTRYRARPNLAADVDARMADSPVFAADDRPAFANHWVQCFVRTDLFGFGVVALGQTIELDYVFEQFFTSPPSFGTPRRPLASGG